MIDSALEIYTHVYLIDKLHLGSLDIRDTLRTVTVFLYFVPLFRTSGGMKYRGAFAYFPFDKRTEYSAWDCVHSGRKPQILYSYLEVHGYHHKTDEAKEC